MECKLLQGDCREVLKTLPEQSVNCCVTSPPYFGLRDYGCESQIGLEQTPDEYVAQLVEVFRQVKRVLRDDGTLWLNLGDSYTGGGAGRNDGNHRADGKPGGMSSKATGVTRNRGRCGLKPKDLIGIPWRVAFALQADGWYLRQDIIWHKPNPMPESVTDRCTKAHEYIFLLSKSAKYWYDNEAIKEPTITKDSNLRDRENAKLNNTPGRTKMMGLTTNSYETRNKRDVWVVHTKAYKEAHFAVFPSELIQPCILAGCPAGGTVLDPFGGSGTTGMVAETLGRNSILIELNPEYVKIQEHRTAQMGLSF